MPYRLSVDVPETKLHGREDTDPVAQQWPFSGSSRPAADRHLLFGLLALQNGLVTRDHLVAAFAKWTSDKSRGIDELLVAEGAISRQRCELLNQLVDIHIQDHGGDPQQSLHVLAGSDLPAAKAELQRLDDDELAHSIAQLPGRRYGNDCSAVRWAVNR